MASIRKRRNKFNVVYYYTNDQGERKQKWEPFDTEEEATQGFFDYKNDYISEFAKNSKDKVPYKTFEAMTSWNVETKYQKIYRHIGY